MNDCGGFPIVIFPQYSMFISFDSGSGTSLGYFPFRYFFDNTSPRFRRTFSLRCNGTRCKPNDCFAFEASVKIRKFY